ncbi:MULTISPECIES: RNA polymerase sigma factor [Erwiniaceae]|nr:MULTISPECIES: RNA polymerase sigma factor [Erwiniaceae]
MWQFTSSPASVLFPKMLLETVDNISNNCRPFSHFSRFVAQAPCAVRHCFYYRSGLDVMTDKSKDLAALYLTEHERLERQIRHRVGCRTIASDLVQDIFLRLWEKAFEWKGDSAAYLTRCARNAAIDHLRAEKTKADYLQGVLAEQYAEESESPQDIVSAQQNIHHIDEILAALPQKTRHIFLLNRIHGRSFSEIATVMGISSRAVAKHTARAVAACEARIGGEHDDTV